MSIDGLAFVRDRARRAASKAASRSPLTEGRRRAALVGAYLSFALSGLAVAGGIVLIIVQALT